LPKAINSQEDLAYQEALAKLAAKNVPTAEGEALQAPTIDPVFFAALGATMGPAAAGKQLLGQMGQNAVLNRLPDAVKRLSQYIPQLSQGDMKDLGRFTDHSTDVSSEATSAVNPQSYGAVLRELKPDSKIAAKVADFVDKITKTPSQGDAEAYDKALKELAERLSQAGFEAPIP
jgi:hypothetical protein